MIPSISRVFFLIPSTNCEIKFQVVVIQYARNSIFTGSTVYHGNTLCLYTSTGVTVQTRQVESMESVRFIADSSIHGAISVGEQGPSPENRLVYNEFLFKSVRFKQSRLYIHV